MLPSKEPVITKGWGVDFEFTGLSMPQQNGCIERKFVAIVNWVCAMLNSGNFNAYLQNGLWAEAVNTTTLLKDNLLTPNRNLSPFQHFWGKRKRSIQSLMQKFGEMCSTTYRDNSHWAKLAN